MKVTGSGQVMTSTIKTKKVGSGASGAFIDELEDSAEVEAKPAASSSGMVGAVNALLSLQEVPDASQGRSRGLVRAQDMLKGLEEIQQSLLTGMMSQSKMMSIAALLRQNRGNIADPRLISLLDDIELRVEVELAKLEMGQA